MKFDDILEYLGDFGAYQKRLYILVCIPAISIACQVLMPIFIMDIPKYRCAIPSLPNDTYKSQGVWHQELVNRTIPISAEDDQLSKCTIIGKNGTAVTCNKWVYDKSQYETTLIMDIGLICGKEIYRSHANMIFFGGNLVGAFVLGIVSDLIGRKKTFMLSIVLHIGTGIGIAFITEYVGFAVLRFFNGMANGGVFMTGYVIGLELVGPSKRTIAGMVIMIFWAIGLFLLGLFGYFIRDWRTLTLVCSCPSVLYLSYWWLLPESPRWLLSKGRQDEAEAIIRKAATVNKVSLPLKLFDKDTLDSGPQAKIYHMFTDCRLLIGTLIIFFNWMVVSMVYYGLGLNVSSLSGNAYLNFTIANVAETLSYFLAIILLDKVGRKALHCGSMLLGGTACLATILPVLYGDSSHQWITTTLSMIGKLGASGAFAIVYVYSAELFPTIVRNSGLGTSSMCARIGGMISPYVSDLIGLICGKEIYRSHANMIFFGGNLVGAFVLGIVSDLIGRKKTFMLSIVLHIGTGIGIAFITEYVGFAVLRFFNGMANGGVFMTGYVIGLELVGPSKRTIAGMVIMIFWAIGLFLLGLFGYFIRDWRTLTLVCSCPSVLYLSYWWLLPESPRWLLSKGRQDEAEAIIRKAATVNEVSLPLKLFDKDTLDSGPQAKIYHMFTDCRLLIGTLIIFFNWMVVSMVYYGLGLNVSSLSGNAYLNFTIANVAETLSYFLAIVLLDKVGRKALHCGSMLLGGIACLATILPVLYGDSSHQWITTALSMIGKLGASGAFAIVYVYSAELFPTIVRNSGLGTSSMCARIGGMISPYVSDLGLIVGGNLKTALPLLVFGATSILAALLCLLLPETLNRKLPETIDDAKELSRSKNKGRAYDLKNTNTENGFNGKYIPSIITDGKI